MKIHNKLDELLSKSIKIKILRLLFNERNQYTGREIARAIKSSPSFTHKSLNELVKEKLVNIEKKGTAHLYKIKEKNYIVREFLGPLFEREKAIYNDLLSFIKKRFLLYKKDIVSIIVFGSVMRKDENKESDIDILIIIKNSQGKRNIDKKIDEIIFEAGENFDIVISPYILTRPEIRKKHNEKSKIIKDILNNNQLLYGEPLERVFA